MSEDEFEFFFRRHRRDAILLHRPYPPHRARRTNCKFGGLPRLPDEVAWPRTPSGRPLHFLAQIDCGDLPFASGLPSRGILFFFGRENEHHLWDHEYPPAETCRVLHVPDAAATPLRQAPPDLPPIGGQRSSHGAWRGILRDGEDAPSSHVEWPIEPLAIDSWPDALLEDVVAPGATGWRAGLGLRWGTPRVPQWEREQARHDRYGQALLQRRDDAVARATGIPVPDLASTVNGGKAAGRAIFFHAESGAATYPQHWLTIRYAARFLLRQLSVSPYPEPGLLARLPREAEAWLERAANADLDAPVADEDRRAFRGWLRALRLAGDEKPLSDEAGRLVFLSMMATIRCWAGDAERAARIDSHVYDAMSFAFSPFTLGGLHASHMLGHPRTWQQPARPDDPIVCLLHLASDAALGWQWGDIDHCGFWIAASDLAARDFSRAWLTIEGG